MKNLYDTLRQYFHDMQQRAETGKVHLRIKDLPWERNRHGVLRYYLHPLIKDTALHSMQVFQHVITRHGGMHRHQGGVVIYVIEGKGYSLVDGERLDWEAEDLILLPMKPGGIAHQHFNLDPNKPSRWLAFISNAFREHSGYEIIQVEESPEWQGANQARKDTGQRQISENPQPLKPASAGEKKPPSNLLDELFAMRDECRERNQNGLKVVKGKDLPWEYNTQGKMRWYVHPRKADTCTKTFMIYVQEIPPNGRSGKQKVPGGIAHVLLSGHLVAEVDGKRYDCEEGDCIALPIKHRGVKCQFFNPDPHMPCRFIAGSPNFYDVLGVDMGSEFEQLEPAPQRV